MIAAFILSLLLILATTANALCCIATGADVAGSGQVVTKIHDGDTFWIGERKIRIAGMDAPELKQPWGKEAAEALSGKILGKPVQLVCQKGKSYDRDVCAVSLNGEDIARWMVGTGNGFDYPKYSKKKYLPDEKLARAERLGLWKELKNGGERPWDHRHKKKKKPVIKKMAGFFNKKKRH